MTSDKERLQALIDGPHTRLRGGDKPIKAGKPKTTAPKGHGATPGTGPAGETCKTCAHLCERSFYPRTFYKCGKARHRWTGGRGSDIRLKDPACSFWEKAP